MENAAWSLNNSSVPFKYLLWLSLEGESSRSLVLFEIFSTAFFKVITPGFYGENCCGKYIQQKFNRAT